MTNAQLRALSRETNQFGMPTQAARLAGHRFDANRMELRKAYGRNQPRGDIMYWLPSVRANALQQRSPAAWHGYGQLRQTVVSPLSVKLP